MEKKELNNPSLENAIVWGWTKKPTPNTFKQIQALFFTF